MIHSDATSLRRLQCMELRGGSGAADEHLAMPGLDVWVVSRPYRAAASGGDVHYVSTCATGRIARVLVADVSGHGVDVGGVAAELRDLMARYVNFLDQRKFFAAMNRRFTAMHHDGGFATAVVVTYFAPTATLSVSNAGHPPPLLWRGAERRWSFLQQSGAGDGAAAGGGGANMPLGVLDAARYDGFDVPLGERDLVLCYTDALTESRGADGDLLSMAGLLEVARGVDGNDPAAVVTHFVAALQDLWPGNLTADDTTLLVLRPNGGGRRVAWQDRLAAPLRVAHGVLRSLTRRGAATPWPELSLVNIGGALFHPLSVRRGRRQSPQHATERGR